jgi:hypothetical protein
MVQQRSANGLYQTGCACRIALCDSVLKRLEKCGSGIGKETLPLPEVTETGHYAGAFYFRHCSRSILLFCHFPRARGSQQPAPTVLPGFGYGKKLVKPDVCLIDSGAHKSPVCSFF